MEFLGSLGELNGQQLLNAAIGLLALSTLLIGASLWGYIFRRYKKDRRTSSLQGFHTKPAGGFYRGAEGSGEGLRCNARENSLRSMLQEHSLMINDLRSYIPGSTLPEVPAEENQVLADIPGTSATQLSNKADNDMTSTPISSGSARPVYFSKSPIWRKDEFVDIDYAEYEKHVQAKAREVTNDSLAPGGRHARKTLMFWKHHTKPRSMRAFVSAACTPLHQTWQSPVRKPTAPGPAPFGSRCESTAPLYTDEYSTVPIKQWPQQLCYETVREGNLIMPRGDDYNMSPYVPLSRPHKIASGPLYLV